MLQYPGRRGQPRRLFFALLTGFVPSLSVAADSTLACRDIEDPAARLACYDAAAQPAPEPLPDAPDSDSSAASEDAPQTEPVAGDALAEPRPMPDFGGPEREDFVAAIKRVWRNGIGRQTVELSNGEVWVQIGSKALPLRPDEVVVIRPGVSRSHLLEKQSGSRQVRVKRVR